MRCKMISLLKVVHLISLLYRQCLVAIWSRAPESATSQLVTVVLLYRLRVPYRLHLHCRLLLHCSCHYLGKGFWRHIAALSSNNYMVKYAWMEIATVSEKFTENALALFSTFRPYVSCTISVSGCFIPDRLHFPLGL